MASIYEAFTQGRQNGEARRTKRTLSQHLQGALGGDQAALSQVYAADPDAGMQAQKLARQNMQDDMGDVAKAADFYRKTGDPKAYAYLHQRLSTNPQFAGLPATIDTPEDQAGAKQFADALVQTYGGASTQAGAVQSTFIDDTGNRVAVMRDGKTQVLGKAQANNQIIEGEGGFYGVNKGNMTATPVQLGGQPPIAQQSPQMPIQNPGKMLDPVVDFPDLASKYDAQVSSLRRDPQRNAAVGGKDNSYHLTGEAGDFVVPQAKKQAFMADAEAKGYDAIDEGDHIHLEPKRRGATAQQFGQGQQLRPAPKTISPAEERRLQLAEEAAARAREAADRSRLGNAPAGFRFRPDGSLEAIPGGPKPAGSAATEDERKAAGWLTQSRKAYDDMEAALKLDAEADNPGILETYIPVDEVANRSRSPARQKYVQGSSAFSEAVLRAATGAGVNRDEAIQKIREVTPQRGDSDEVKAQKRESLGAYLQSLEQRAGRAAAGARPAANSGPVRIQSASEYEALPSGAEFFAPDGTKRRKR